MALAEKPKVRTGEHFTEDALPRISEIFDSLRQNDANLKGEGRRLSGNIQVKEDLAYVTYIAKDYSEGDIKRKAILTGALKYKDGNDRFVHTILEESSEGKITLKIEDTLYFPAHHGKSPKEVRTATFIKEDGKWQNTLAGDVLVEGKEETTMIFTPKHVTSEEVLGHCLEIMEASEPIFKWAMQREREDIEKAINSF